MPICLISLENILWWEYGYWEFELDFVVTIPPRMIYNSSSCLCFHLCLWLSHIYIVPKVFWYLLLLNVDYHWIGFGVLFQMVGLKDSRISLFVCSTDSFLSYGEWKKYAYLLQREEKKYGLNKLMTYLVGIWKLLLYVHFWQHLKIIINRFLFFCYESFSSRIFPLN